MWDLALRAPTSGGGPLPHPRSLITPDLPSGLLTHGVGDTVEGNFCTVRESEDSDLISRNFVVIGK